MPGKHIRTKFAQQPANVDKQAAVESVGARNSCRCRAKPRFPHVSAGFAHRPQAGLCGSGKAGAGMQSRYRLVLHFRFPHPGFGKQDKHVMACWEDFGAGFPVFLPERLLLLFL